jgi:mycoredoxin
VGWTAGAVGTLTSPAAPPTPARERTKELRVPDVILYWRPMCGYCEQLKRELARRGVAYASIDIWQDRSKAAVVKAATGGDEVVPTVEVGGRFLVNPSPDEVVAALEVA